MEKTDKIFSDLGLNLDNGLFLTKEDHWKKETSFPNRVKRLLERKIKPQAFFCFDNKPLILFFENHPNTQELHEDIWNFNECPIAIIIQNDVIEIFNGFNFLKDKKTLEKLGGIEKLNNFTYFELVTGRTWEQYQEQLNYKNRVDYHLLQNIKAARKLLLGQDEYKAKLANAILGKVIFVRYLIDREVKMKFDGKLRTWSNDEFCKLLEDPNQVQQFFEYLDDKDKGFNGDLFPLTADEYKQVTANDYQILKRLLQGDDIEKNQPSLFEFYDFSIIPIEFISNVYELFIGGDNQKKEGAYYTPLFLVDYILKQTVEKKLKSEGSDHNCKVLDPACGSGIFLVETIRKIIEKFSADTGIDVKSEKFKTAIKNLAKENLFGIDKDSSAIQVAIFSIYLTLLDYLEPPGIETFKFPVLLNENFFVDDFFDEGAVFNARLRNHGFDYILGNPPWEGGGMKEVGLKYLNKRRKRETQFNKKYQIAINNNEIVEGFVFRISDFCTEHTVISLIVKSTILYNLGYNDGFSKFRQYWLEEFYIKNVFELAPVRHEVFDRSNDPAIAPAAIIIYSYANGQNTNKNIVEHIVLKQSRFFSLFKIFTINRTDYKLVEQKKLKDFDWLWKVLVYGSYLDFNFIKRLKEQYVPIKNVVSNKAKFIESTGIHSRTKAIEKPKNTSSIDNLPFLKTDAIKSFHIEYSNTEILEKDKIDIIKDVRIYHHPMLLVREGIDMNTLTAKCAISTKDVLFKDSITSIKALSNNDLGVLDNIAAIFSTFLFSYYAINTFASIGIERERVKNYNKFSLPYLELGARNSVANITQAFQDINSENKKPFVDNFKIQSIQKIISKELDKINSAIYQTIDFSDIELALIDYALEINLNLIIGDDIKRKKLFCALVFEDETLKNYASLFIDRFKSKLDTNERKFLIEIWHTSQIVGMFFKMVPASEYTKSLVWVDKPESDLAILSLLTKISSEKITEKLFVQKDIRGFEKDYFYIFKPNEKRLWHKAIGYLDVNEFADAILMAGKDGK